MSFLYEEMHATANAPTVIANADVDLIVEMPPDVVLGRSFFDLRRELKEAFGRTVDLHLPPNDAARPEYVRVLERTKVLVFDESSEG